MANRLPKYYIVQEDQNDPRWFKYIADLNTKYGSTWTGTTRGNWYGYDGNKSSKGTSRGRDISYFDNNPTRLTLDEYEELSKEIDGMPKNYGIQCTNPEDPRWKRYIKYFNSVCMGWQTEGTSINYWYCCINGKGNLYGVPDIGIVRLTLDDFDRLVPEEFVVPERWGIHGSPELEQWIQRHTGRYGNGTNPKAIYYPICPDLTVWSLVYSSTIPPITFEQFIKYIAKPAALGFDKDSWVVETETAAKRLLVAQWFDAQKTDADKAVGHNLVSDAPYLGWNNKRWFRDSCSGRKSITWEQFLTLKTPPTMETPKTQPVSRAELKVMYWKVCEDWQEIITDLLKKDLFAEIIPVEESLLLKAYKAGNAGHKEMLRKYFTIPEEDKNAFVGKFYTDRLSVMSQELFGDKKALIILDKNTPEGTPEYKNRALEFSKDYIVSIGPAKDGGTYVAIYKK